MKAVNFTKDMLATLTAKSKTYQVKDRATPGLFVRVFPGGCKTFLYYKRVADKVVRIKIGRVEELSIEAARKQAVILNGQMVSGVRVHELRKEKRKEHTFRQLFERYYNDHLLLHTKRPGDTKACLKLHILPRVGSWRVGEISKVRMKEIHKAIGTSSGKAAANRSIDLASSVFNYGIKEELFSGKNPCMGIKRFTRRKRDRFFGKEELALFFQALENEDPIYQDFFQLSLFIGARKSTMLAMRYDQLDFDLQRWRLGAELSKNDDVNVYELPEAALEILKRRRTENNRSNIPSPFVFPGTGKAGHLADPKKSFQRIRARMKVDDIRIHDLRRTLGSYMAISNASLPIIGKALNHKSQESTVIYARLSRDPIQQAVNAAVNAMVAERFSNRPNDFGAENYEVKLKYEFTSFFS